MTKTILLIIAFQNYQDYEYAMTKQVLENAGIKVVTTSSQTGTASGSFGDSAQVDLDLKKVNTADYDAVIFIGGAGAVGYQTDQLAHQIAKQTVEQNKILGAICIAPTILANAGVLKNKKATVWTSEIEKSPIKILENGGAKYLNKNVVVDGKIITADGPPSAQNFGQRIVKMLEQIKINSI